MEVDTAKDKAKPEKEGGLFGWWGSVVAKVKGITDQPDGEASSSDAAQQEQSEAAHGRAAPKLAVALAVAALVQLVVDGAQRLVHEGLGHLGAECRNDGAGRGEGGVWAVGGR